MTKNEALKEIRKLGLSATAIPNTGEIRVNYKPGDPRRSGDGYYTDDPQDAVDTARHMTKVNPGSDEPR